MNLTLIILLIAAASAGYLVFYLLKIPTPAMLGPFAFIIGLSFFNVTIPPLGFEFSFILQSLLGIHIGILVNRQAFKDMKKLLFTSLIMIVWTLVMTFGLGRILIHYYQMDLATALLCTAPAGIAETGLLAVTVNADVAVVSLFQLTRMILTLSIVPLVVSSQRSKVTDRKESFLTGVKQRAMNISGSLDIRALKRKPAKPSNWKQDSIKSIKTIAIGFLGGYVGIRYDIPAGAMMGSFFTIALIALSGIKLQTPPRYLKILMQMGIGTSMAVNVVQGSQYPIRHFLLPLVTFTIILFSTALINAYIFKRINQWDNSTSLLAAAPAGLTPMSILAYEYAEDPLGVSIIHMTRLIVVKIVILPYIVLMLMN